MACRGGSDGQGRGACSTHRRRESARFAETPTWREPRSGWPYGAPRHPRPPTPGKGGRRHQQGPGGCRPWPRSRAPSGRRRASPPSAWTPLTCASNRCRPCFTRACRVNPLEPRTIAPYSDWAQVCCAWEHHRHASGSIHVSYWLHPALRGLCGARLLSQSKPTSTLKSSWFSSLTSDRGTLPGITGTARCGPKGPPACRMPIGQRGQIPMTRLRRRQPRPSLPAPPSGGAGSASRHLACAKPWMSGCARHVSRCRLRGRQSAGHRR
jgi:hypothetical protein